jgi:hypothetical protein
VWIVPAAKPQNHKPGSPMGSSIRSKGSINQSDDSARPGRALCGAVSSAKGANHGSFDNFVDTQSDNNPRSLNASLKRAPASAYSEGDAYSDDHPSDNPAKGF